MSKPGWAQGGAPDAGKPQIYDQAPPQWTGVPVERDPVSGRLLTGDPLGRGDKGRSARSPGKAALITAGAVAAVTAVVLTVVLVTGGGDDPEPTASAGAVQTSGQTTTSAAPTTTTTTPTPAVETGPRDIPVNLIQTASTPPPGFAPDPAFGTVGEVRSRTWTITGPCDGTGPCDVQHCQAPGQCSVSFSGTPEGSGYVARFTTPVQWGAPECTGGSIDNTITWSFTGVGETAVISGSWVEQAAQVLFTGSDGRDCGLYLGEFQLASP